MKQKLTHYLQQPSFSVSLQSFVQPDLVLLSMHVAEFKAIQA